MKNETIAKPAGKRYAGTSGWEIGQEVVFKGNVHTIYDIDEGYDILALDGEKYICPNYEDNRCIESTMSECAPNDGMRLSGGVIRTVNWLEASCLNKP